MPKAVTVEILGNEYVLRSDAGEDRVRQVAALLNDRLNEVLATTNTSSTLAAAVLAALEHNSTSSCNYRISRRNCLRRSRQKPKGSSR